MSQLAPPAESLAAHSQDSQAPQSSTGQRYPAIKGYHLTRLLGGGGFSRVYKAVNPAARPPEAACKVVSYAPIVPGMSSARHAPNPQALQKEVQIHSLLKHIHVLRFLGADEYGTKSRPAGIYVPGLYMLLEYAAGGDLFDKISPDVGVTEDLAQFYFRQLIAGLEYIHGQGIVHRDIKPENLLLSAEGDLKIADFGLCSVYRYKGKERALKGACGSLPYIAPEMNGTPYHGEGVDVWSAGVCLFALMAGNTPWDEPSSHAPEYKAYVRGQLLRYEPWCNIPKVPLDLIVSMLEPDPQRRLTLAEVQQHPWFVRWNPLLEGTTSQEERTGTLVEALMSSLIQGGNLPLALDLHPDGQRAQPVAYPAASQPSALSSHHRPLASDLHDAMNLDAESAPLPLPPASMSMVDHSSSMQGVPSVSATMTQLSARRRTTLTQNPGATQFQALWAGMTQWTEVAGATARFSTQTTRFFSSSEPWQVVPAVMRVLSRAKAETKVFALDPRRGLGDEDGGAGDMLGSSEHQMRIDLQHQADMVELVAGMHALTPQAPEPEPELSQEEAAWRRLLDAAGAATPGASPSPSTPYRPRGARIMVALTDRRKCHLLGNVWIDPLSARQHGSIRTLVLFDRSSGSPLEWRRLFKTVLHEPTIAQSVVPM